MRVLNAKQMREADAQAIERFGMPSIVLMENAGRQVVSAMEAAFGLFAGRRVAVLAGRGNNGGDGFVVARVLWQGQCDVLVCLAGTAADVRGDARINLSILQKLGIPVVEVSGDQDWELAGTEVLGCDFIVDALFGTGLSTPLVGVFETIISDVNASDIPVIAVDLPSGLSADSSAPIGPVMAATITVAFGAPKLPLVMPPGESWAGSLVVADIGIPRTVIGAVEGPRIEYMTAAEALALVPLREADGHKGSYGHVCVVAGSPGKTGAAHLGGLAALRSGAGLATVATPASCAPVVAGLAAEYMTLALPETGDHHAAAAASTRVAGGGFDVVAVGPGLGTGPEQRALVMALLASTTKPLVLDADALTVLSGGPQDLVARDGQVIVVTPHPGEMARLVGSTPADVQAHRLEIATAFASDYGVIVVLKGYRTLIAAPDGRVYINPTGNAGMATGGSGDVLTGAIAGWLAQIADPVDACRLAVYLHGAAGDLAARAEGQVSMTAGDILQNLGPAVLALIQPDEAPDEPA